MLIGIIGYEIQYVYRAQKQPARRLSGYYRQKCKGEEHIKNIEKLVRGKTFGNIKGGVNYKYLYKRNEACFVTYYVRISGAQHISFRSVEHILLEVRYHRYCEEEIRNRHYEHRRAACVPLSSEEDIKRNKSNVYCRVLLDHKNKKREYEHKKRVIPFFLM